MTLAAMPPAPEAIVLQTLALPDLSITTEFELFMRRRGLVRPMPDTGAVAFGPGGEARFDTWVNLLNLTNWTRHCRIEGLGLRLAGTGRFNLHLWRVTTADGGAETILKTEVTLSDAAVTVPLDAALPAGAEAAGLVMLSLCAPEGGMLTSGAFVAAPLADAAPPRLAIVITTFRREDEVARTAARITAWLDGPGAAHVRAAGAAAHLFIVDNGQSLTGAQALRPHRHLTVLPNPNLGGAGGFARGLAAAQDAGFSHCLFMDDDAAFQMENLTRTLAFLRLARHPDAALAGAMVAASLPWMLWESGAVFDRYCRPRFGGTDLRNPHQVARMELASAGPTPRGFYGGFWFLAFPVAAARHFPFPFFVRGDDISFSLANRFRMATLNGVVSLQEDFAAKESPLTLYLDLRNHLHHHLVQEGMQIGMVQSALIVARFVARSVVRMHYDSAAAQLLAWEHVMQGPGFFAANADMAAPRAEVTALIRGEAWQPVASAHRGGPPLSGAARLLRNRLAVRAMKYTLNGHLLPFWGLLRRRTRVAPADRGALWPLWGATEATFFDHTGTRAYRVRHDKARFLAILRRAWRLFLRWRRIYPTLERSYRDTYPAMTDRDFWQPCFALPEDAPARIEAAE